MGVYSFFFEHARHSMQGAYKGSDQSKTDDEIDIYCLDKANSDERNEILKDLLWTLYSKVEAVLRGYRFIETCAHRTKKVRRAQLNKKCTRLFPFFLSLI